MLVDTSGLLAAIDGSQRAHAACAAAVGASRGPLLLSPFVLAELDYLLGTRVSAAAQDALLAEVERGAYRLEGFSAADVGRARAIAAAYRPLELGLADASIVVLAERHGVRDVLTLDERHFRALRVGPGRTKRFRVLPADAPRAR
jgi:predicted nucleic acid-binding protein